MQPVPNRVETTSPLHPEVLWEQIQTTLLTEAADKQLIDWADSVDATICCAHRYATNTTRP